MRRPRIGLRLPLVGFWLVCAPFVFAQWPTADNFNPEANWYVYTLALDPDGGVLVGGSFGTLGGQTRNRIGRINGYGEVDIGFNPGADSGVVAIAMQTNGKILVGGAFTTLGGQNRSRIGRLNPDGTLDSSFTLGANGQVNCLAVQADGKILVGGYFTALGGTNCNHIGRLNFDGSLDGSFNPGANSWIDSIAVQADGKIVVGGAFTNLSGQSRAHIGRLNADGTIDPDFNPGANDFVDSLAVQADGKILVGGHFTSLGGTNRSRLGRLNPDGSMDTGFNPGANGPIHTFGLRTDGKILIGGGFSTLGGQTRTNLGSLNPSGSVEAAFNLGANDQVNALVIQPDGRTLVGGYFTRLAEQNRGRIGRLNNTNAASQTLALAGDNLTWLRGGSCPEVWRATFEAWNGTAWTNLGSATRIAGGWQLTGVTLASNATVRGRGWTSGGIYNGSTWILEDGAGPLLITSQPVSRTNNARTTITFSATAIGSSPIAYQWFKDDAPMADGVQISGAGTPVLTVSNALGADAGDYFLVASNVFGSVTSSVANLEVIDPLITGQPANRASAIGSNATFSVTAIGTPPLNYLWRKDGVFLAGTTNSSLTLTNLQGADAGKYDVVVANGFGSMTSAVATLTINLATVDTNFNPGANGGVYAFALQADGKILVGGNFSTLGGSNLSRIGRLNPNGSVDSAFNPGAAGQVYCLAVQPDGKILVGGEFASLGSLAHVRIGRLNPNGSADSSFALSSGANNTVSALALQPDGKILVGGNFSILGGTNRNFIGRLNTNGTVDASFNPGANGRVNSLALQPDGKILVGGSFTTLGGQSRMNIGRLNSDGSVDGSFNPGASSTVNAILVQPDGKIIVAGGFGTLAGQTSVNLGRLNSDGTLDDSFSRTAVTYSGGVLSLALQADGKIVLCGGFSYLGGLYRPYIGRLNADGSVDLTFNSSTSYYTTFALAVQADGKILVGGGISSLGGVSRANLGRLNNTGPAIESLTLDNGTLTWMRSGSGPEVWRTIFEAWSGTIWTNLGTGARVPGGWQLTGVSLAPNSTLRGRGYTSGGQYNGSSWFVERQTGSLLISAQPASRTNNAGTNVSFTVSAMGESPAYQWWKDGTPLADGGKVSGVTTATLTLANILGGNSGNYSVVMSNSFGSVTSAVARLTVMDPIIASQPVNEFAEAGNAGAFGVSAIGTSPLSYQWRKNGVPLSDSPNISGATAPTLVLNNLFGADRGGYSVIISNQFRSVTSVVAFLSVTDPRLTSQPVAQNLDVGTNAIFDVTAVGSSPLNYQWRHDGLPLDGATSSALTLTNLQGIHAGKYVAVVTNAFGSVTSAVALLTVNVVTADDWNPRMNWSANVAVQPDGKLLVAGAFTSIGGLSRSNLSRLNVDGTVDTNFNPRVYGIRCLAVQLDGKIVVGGRFTNLDGYSRTHIGRLNSDGTVDTSFNPSASDEIYSVISLANGKILLGGLFQMIGGQYRTNIARLNSDGTLDTSFDPGAVRFNSLVTSGVFSLASQSDGKVLVGGYFTNLSGANRNFIGRLNADGSADASFNPGANSNINCLAVQADGKILAGGRFTSLGGGARNYLGRLNSNGSLDTSFNPAPNNHIQSVAVQTDGKILVVGSFTTLAGQSRSYIGRLNTDGSVDTRFNPGANSTVNTLAVQPDGKILASGGFTILGGQTCTNIGRLNNTGPAAQSLGSAADSLLWLRGGSSPELQCAMFDYSTNAMDWIMAGEGSRITGGWHLTNVALPLGSTLRARGQVSSGQYNGSCGLIESTALVGAPLIMTHPASRTNYATTTATFSVTALGAAPLHYQWLKDNTGLIESGNIAGPATSNLTVLAAQLSDAGNYSVIVSNNYGSVTSIVAALTILPDIPEAVLPQLSGSNQLRFTITGTPGRVLHLQGSPDLFHWAILQTVTNAGGTLIVTNPLPVGRSIYFYRTESARTFPLPPLPSPWLGRPVRLTSGDVRFELNSVPGSVWRLQGSPDIFHWGTYELVTNATGTTVITNSPVASPESYFYRVVQP